MRKILKLVTSRLFWASLLILVQFLFLCYVAVFASYFKGWGYIFTAVSIIMAFVVFTRSDNNAYKAVWIFLICIFPVFGGLIYIVCANKKIGRLSRKKIEAFRRQLPIPKDSNNEDVEIDSPYDRLAYYIKERTGFEPLKGSGGIYFSCPDDFFLDLLEEIRGAKKFIFLEFFIIDKGKWWDEILTLLLQKRSQGVDIRIIYDDLGSINTLPSGYDHYINSLNIPCVAFNRVRMHFNPRLNFRDHRKIVCIDGRCCYTGGLNIADEYSNDKVRFGYWKDNAVKLLGSEIRIFTYMFLEMWYCLTDIKDENTEYFLPAVDSEGDGAVIAFSDNPMDRTTIARDVYIEVIRRAERYVYLTTPYLIPDEDITSALIVASHSGVDVRIIVPLYPDKKSINEVSLSNYIHLVKNGVKIYQYIPGFIHSKTFISDDRIAVLGSANIDYRSFYLHFELSVVFIDSSFVRKAKEDYERTLLFSKSVDIKEVNNIGFLRRVLRYFLRLFSSAF